MMTSFGWKRKACDKICSAKSRLFESDARDEDDVEEINSGEIDWLTLHPKRKCIQLEDGLAKSNRLREEGVVLATAERYWEALQKWDEALQFTPDESKLYDMKAQVIITADPLPMCANDSYKERALVPTAAVIHEDTAYLCVGEVYPAVKAATKAVSLSPTWWEAHQILGRAHLQIGEVRMALKSFQRAVHLYPADEELWREDLKWAQSLLLQKQSQTEQLCSQDDSEENSRSLKIVELNEDGTVKPDQSVKECERLKGKQGQMGTDLLHMSAVKKQELSGDEGVKAVPHNYVYMRD